MRNYCQQLSRNDLQIGELSIFNKIIHNHICMLIPEFVEAANKDEFDISLNCQPANSPDLNILDLGFFRAIDSLHHQEANKCSF